MSICYRKYFLSGVTKDLESAEKVKQIQGLLYYSKPTCIIPTQLKIHFSYYLIPHFSGFTIHFRHIILYKSDSQNQNHQSHLTLLGDSFLHLPNNTEYHHTVFLQIQIFQHYTAYFSFILEDTLRADFVYPKSLFFID